MDNKEIAANKSLWEQIESLSESIKSLSEAFKFHIVKLRQSNELRKQNKFCDLSLKCEDGFEIRVHRIVVSSASNYFNDLLTLPMKEKFQETITLPGITGDVLEKIINFIYTSKFNEEIEDVEKIVKYAVIFQFEELVEICSLALSKLLPIRGNLCKYVKFAKDNLIHSLGEKCEEYLRKKFDDIFGSRRDWNLTYDQKMKIVELMESYEVFQST